MGLALKCDGATMDHPMMDTLLHQADSFLSYVKFINTASANLLWLYLVMRSANNNLDFTIGSNVAR